MYIPQSHGVFTPQSTDSAANVRMWQRGSICCSLLIDTSIYVLIARTLGPWTFGSYLFVRWLATVATPLIGAGVSIPTSRQLALLQSRQSPRLVAGIFYFLWYRQHRSILLYSLLYLLLAIPLAHLFHAFSPPLLLLAGLSMLPLLLSSVAGTTLRSQRRVDLLVGLHLFSAFLTLLLVIIAALIAGTHIEAFLLACALASTFTLILAVICIIRLLPLESALRPGIFLQEKLEQNLTHNWLSFTLDVIIWQPGELLLLACWHNPADLGFYALSALITMGVMSLTPALFMHWVLPLCAHSLPRYFNAYDSFIKTSCYIVFLAVIICIIFSIFSPKMICYCLGTVYLPVVRPLRIMLIAAVFGSIATISLTHLKQRSPQKAQQYLDIGIAMLKIVLAVPLIAQWGIVGAAIASTLAQCACALVAILFCRKLLIAYETDSAKDR